MVRHESAKLLSPGSNPGGASKEKVIFITFSFFAFFYHHLHTLSWVIKMWKKVKPYVISIIIALLVGGLSAILTKDNMEVYSTINRPPLAPPASIFPIVWGILFILMGISSAIIYKSHSKDSKKSLTIYAIQLLVNFFWSLIFFNLRNYLFAFIWILFLWLLIIYMIFEFYKTNKIAAYLQIPYLLWVTFATYLTFMIWILN